MYIFRYSMLGYHLRIHFARFEMMHFPLKIKFRYIFLHWNLLKFRTLILIIRLQQKKYRQQPYNFKHTSVADSPDIVHAKLSGQITNEVSLII